MAAPWLATNKYWCTHCRIFITDNLPSRTHHEQGVKHKENVQKTLKAKREERLAKEAEESKLQRQLDAIQRAADRAYATDIRQDNICVLRSDQDTQVYDPQLEAERQMMRERALAEWRAKRRLRDHDDEEEPSSTGTSQSGNGEDGESTRHAEDGDDEEEEDDEQATEQARERAAAEREREVRAQIESMLSTSRDGVARLVDRILSVCVEEVRREVSSELLAILERNVVSESITTAASQSTPTATSESTTTAAETESPAARSQLRTLLEGKLGTLSEEDFLLLRALGKAHHRARLKGEALLEELRQTEAHEKEKYEKEKEQRAANAEEKPERYESAVRGGWQQVDAGESVFGSYTVEGSSSSSSSSSSSAGSGPATQEVILDEDEDFEDRETRAVMEEATRQFFKEAAPRHLDAADDDDEEEGHSGSASSASAVVFKKRRRGVANRSNRKKKPRS